MENQTKVKELNRRRMVCQVGFAIGSIQHEATICGWTSSPPDTYATQIVIANF